MPKIKATANNVFQIRKVLDANLVCKLKQNQHNNTTKPFGVWPTTTLITAADCSCPAFVNRHVTAIYWLRDQKALYTKKAFRYQRDYWKLLLAPVVMKPRKDKTFQTIFNPSSNCPEMQLVSNKEWKLLNFFH